MMSGASMRIQLAKRYVVSFAAGYHHKKITVGANDGWEGHGGLRGLQTSEDFDDDGTSPLDGTIGIVIAFFVIYCFIWAPRSILRRCRARRDNEHQANEYRRYVNSLASNDALGMGPEVEIALVESSLRNMMASMTLMMESQTSRASNLGGVLSEERREYIANLLINKKVVLTIAGDDSPSEAPLEQVDKFEKGDLKIVAISANDFGEDKSLELDSKDAEHCAICLVDYQDGDEICWSHNLSCNHAFHHNCIIEWLLSHDECPCCRHNYLSFFDETEIEIGSDQPNGALVPTPVTSRARDEDAQLARNLQLLYQFSRSFPSVPTFLSMEIDNDVVSSENDDAGVDQDDDLVVSWGHGADLQFYQITPDGQPALEDEETGAVSQVVDASFIPELQSETNAPCGVKR